MSDEAPGWAVQMESRLQGGLGQLEGTLGQLQGSFGQLEGSLGQLQGGLGQLEGTLGQLQGSLGQLESRMQASLGVLRADVMERIDRLQHVVTLIRDDVAVNFGASSAVKLANDNTREELRALGDVVSAMHRQIQRLQTDVRELRGEP